MMRRSIILITLALLATTPLAALATEIVDCCEAHNLAPRMSEHVSCTEQPCCLSPATPATSHRGGALAKTTLATDTPSTAHPQQATSSGSRLQGPPDFDPSGLKARLTTVLRC